MLPGVILAILVSKPVLTVSLALNIIVAIVSACLLASANYTINEWLDAETDRHHPDKQYRPSVMGTVSAAGVYFQWFLLCLVGFVLAATVNNVFLLVAVFFVVMGLIYNVKPMRSKDRQYFDVITESVNNPVRLLLGWCAVTTVVFPPSSIVLAYWMGGCFSDGRKTVCRILSYS